MFLNGITHAPQLTNVMDPKICSLNYWRNFFKRLIEKKTKKNLILCNIRGKIKLLTKSNEIGDFKNENKSTELQKCSEGNIKGIIGTIQSVWRK